MIGYSSRGKYPRQIRSVGPVAASAFWLAPDVLFTFPLEPVSSDERGVLELGSLYGTSINRAKAKVTLLIFYQGKKGHYISTFNVYIFT